MNASPISVNASVSDAAANTVTSPDTAGSVAPTVAVVVSAESAASSSPHDAEETQHHHR